MNLPQVLALLEEHKDDDYVQRKKSTSSNSKRLKRLGIGLTVLRKLAKQIGRDHVLARQLWQTDLYDARIIALLIDDPKQMTREQAESQVEHLKQGHLAHVFSTCGASLAKTSFVVPLSVDWIKSKDEMRRRCGYGLLYEISKSYKKSTPDEVFFMDRLGEMRNSFDCENQLIKGAIGGALLGIGKRSVLLNKEALDIARSFGPIPMEANGKKCEPFNVEKHLTSDYLKKKLGLQD